MIRSIIKIGECKICGSTYETHSNRTDACSRKCRHEYRNKFGKNGLPQRNEENLLLCYTCLNYKNEEQFSLASKSSSPLPVRNRRNSTCKECCYITSEKYRKSINNTLNGTLKVRLNQLKSGARKRNIEFNDDLTVKDLLDLYNKQNGKCALTNEKLELINNNYNLKGLSVDRINSSKGYVNGNMQLVCWAVNQMKFDMTQEELFYWCNEIINNKIIKDAQDQNKEITV